MEALYSGWNAEYDRDNEREDNMTYVINILQNLEAMSIDRNEDKERAQNALAEILSMEKRLSDDFDSEKELREARAEKYENLG